MGAGGAWSIAGFVLITQLNLRLVEELLWQMSYFSCQTIVAQTNVISCNCICRRHVPFSMLPHIPLSGPRDQSELAQLEAVHRIFDLFIWLSWRFQPAFVGREIAAEQQAVCARLINEGLHTMAANRTSRQDSAAVKMRQKRDALQTSMYDSLQRREAHLPSASILSCQSFPASGMALRH